MAPNAAARELAYERTDGRRRGPGGEARRGERLSPASGYTPLGAAGGDAVDTARRELAHPRMSNLCTTCPALRGGNPVARSLLLAGQPCRAPSLLPNSTNRSPPNRRPNTENRYPRTSNAARLPSFHSRQHRRHPPPSPLPPRAASSSPRRTGSHPQLCFISPCTATVTVRSTSKCAATPSASQPARCSAPASHLSREHQP